MKKNTLKTERRNKIRKRIRSTIRGTAERPRLSIFKSNKHVYLQLIDDLGNATITTVSTKSQSLQSELKGKAGVESAKIIGEALAKTALDQGIKKVFSIEADTNITELLKPLRKVPVKVD